MSDQQFMQAALEIAALGRSSVEPNPMVGAVIVRDGIEIARGFHQRFGGPHAEVDAIAAAGGADLRGATLYVTLEPCCHRNKKTPPCVDAILAAGISRVIVAMEDPDENVRGRGLSALRQAGVEVSTGVCAEAASELLRAYTKLRTRKRPWVICKWAQTADGYLALGPSPSPTAGRDQGGWISSEQSRAHAHALRGLCDGILVGVSTVLADDPLLTNRGSTGKQPTRVVLDIRLQTPPDCQLVKTARQVPVIIATAGDIGGALAKKGHALRDLGVEVIQLPASRDGVDLGALLDELGRRQWTYLLVEGGAKVLGSFINHQLADEIVVYVSPRTLRGDLKDLPQLDIHHMSPAVALTLQEEQSLGGDRMLRFVVCAPA